MSLQLRLEGEGSGCFVLRRDEMFVGRGPTCEVILEASTVSSRHGLFRARGERYEYTDLGSRNGSALERDGVLRALATGEPVPLQDGDLLLLGGAEEPARLRVEAAAAPYAAAAGVGATVIAEAPLADLLRSPDDALLGLSARLLRAPEPGELAQIALETLAELTPFAAQRALRLRGPGFDLVLGETPPVELQPGDEVRITERGVVAPLRALGSDHGHLLAWGGPVLPEVARQLAVVAPLLALAAQSLGGRAAPPLAAGTEPIGTDAAFRAAVELARQVAHATVPVLVRGETGSGKELIARLVHEASPRAEAPFVAVNCAAVPESLLESQLFGHARGAFTGATADRAGLLEEADGGTLFLDEIGDMPQAMQAKLLRALETGQVRRLGEARDRAVDLRLVSATHRDLESMAAEGGFRADLMYRINTATVVLPPLRARGADLHLLAHHLLGQLSREADKRILGFSPEALAALEAHDWPGNVRELRNEVALAVALSPEGAPVRPSAFSPRLRIEEEPAPRTLAAIVLRAERSALEAALAQTGGNVSLAAEALGLSRAGIYKVMKRTGVTR